MDVVKQIKTHMKLKYISLAWEAEHPVWEHTRRDQRGPSLPAIELDLLGGNKVGAPSFHSPGSGDKTLSISREE